MLKHIYRIVVCIIVFVVSMFIFSRNIHEENNEQQEITTYEMGDATFPIITAREKGHEVTLLHGYTTTLDVTTVRDGIIPVGDSNKLNIRIEENDVKISKGTVEISNISNGKAIENGNLDSFESKDGVISTSYVLTGEYKDSREYVATITLVTDKGDKIKYYSRIKKVSTEHLGDIMDYAMEFHNDVLDKKTAANVVNHIEPNSSMQNTDLAYVNINSSLNLISYGSLGPKVITEVHPKLHEVTKDTAIVELEFYVQAQTGSGAETYKVNESFRIRWTSTRMYLLGYDRTMESVFDVNLVSVSANEFKLGITNNSDADYLVTADESKLAFVRNGELWYYNTATNDMVSVFSFVQEDTDYVRDRYDNHDIKLLGMDELGNLDFMVYGYMNRGEYEGREGIALYKYYVNDSRVEEQLYIPSDVPFNILEGYVSDFAYINAHDVFFFSLGGDIYSYDMITDKLDTIATDVDESHMTMPKTGSFMAWMDSEDTDATIHIMNLETEDERIVEAKEGTCIRLLGVLGSSVIYGFAQLDEIADMADGSKVIPISLIYITDMEGNIQKEYIPENCYVTTAKVEGNKVKINQVKRDSDGYYYPSGEDYIFNADMEKEDVKTTFRLTDTTMTEWYMTIPDSVNIGKTPAVTKAVMTEISDEGSKVIRIDFDDVNDDIFYAYGYHGLVVASVNAGEAVSMADDNMGLVYDNKGTLIWARGIADDGASVKVDLIYDGRSITSCMKMLLSSDKVELEEGVDLMEEEGSIADKLNKYSKHRAINLTGADMEEVFYYISEGRPVMAMKSSSSAVLIIAYSKAKVKFIDADGSTKIVSKKEASRMFEEVGNIFITLAK